MKYLSLTDPWLYTSIMVSACSALVSALVGQYILILEVPLALRFFGFCVIFATMAVDQLIYQWTLRSEPWFHLGFYPSVVIPVILQAFLLLLIVFFSIRALWRGLRIDGIFLSLNVPLSILLLFEKIVFGIAYASPASIVLVLCDVIIVTVKLVFRPKRITKEKDE